MLDSRSLGLVGITLLGLWMLAQAFSYAVLLLSAWPSMRPGLFLPQLIPLLGNAAGGGVLVAFRRQISRTFFAPSEQPQQDEEEGSLTHDFFVALLGLSFVVWATSQAAETEFALVYQFRMQQELGYHGDFFGYMMSGEAWSRRVQYLTTAVCGLALLVWSSSAVAVWKALRAAGRSRPPAA